MTGLPAVKIPPDNEIETEAEREAFFYFLYHREYSKQNLAGSVARALHKASAYHLIRTRDAYSWRYLNQKNNWNVNADHLQQVWSEWLRMQGE